MQKHAALLMPKTMLDDLQLVFQMAERELRHTGWKDWPERIAVLPPMLQLLAPTR